MAVTASVRLEGHDRRRTWPFREKRPALADRCTTRTDCRQTMHGRHYGRSTSPSPLDPVRRDSKCGCKCDRWVLGRDGPPFAIKVSLTLIVARQTEPQRQQQRTIDAAAHTARPESKFWLCCHGLSVGLGHAAVRDVKCTHICCIANIELVQNFQ